MNILKNKTFMTISVICILFAGGLVLYNLNSESTVSSNKENNSIVISNSENLVQFESVDDLVKYADNIVIGSIIDDADFSETTREYTLSVENELKGSVNSSQIKVYETNDTLSSGNRYILFLESSKSEYFPETSYTSVDKESIIKITEDALTCQKSDILKDSKNTDDFIKNVKASPNISYIRENSSNEKTLSKDDLFTQSDCVFRIIPDTVSYENKYIKSVKAELVKSYKGEFDENAEILLPADAETGKEYIVFLKKEGKTLTLADKDNGIMREDDGNWSNFINKYEK